jgi:hypothetical protein
VKVILIGLTALAAGLIAMLVHAAKDPATHTAALVVIGGLLFIVGCAAGSIDE